MHEVFDAKPILAERAGASGVVLWLFVVALGVLILAIASWRDWGVVTQWQSIGVLGWTAYAVLVYQQKFDRQIDLAGAELARRLGAP